MARLDRVGLCGRWPGRRHAFDRFGLAVDVDDDGDDGAPATVGVWPPSPAEVARVASPWVTAAPAHG